MKFQNRCNFFSSGAIGSILRSFESTDKNDQASVVENEISRNQNFHHFEVQKFRKNRKKRDVKKRILEPFCSLDRCTFAF